MFLNFNMIELWRTGLGMWVGACVAWIGVAAAEEEASLADLTVVVYHAGMPESVALAREYAQARGIDEDRLIGLEPPRMSTITRQDFEETIRDPLRVQFGERGWWRMESTLEGAVVSEMRPRVMALMHGIPRRIAPVAKDAPQGQEDAASVDSELAALALVGAPVAGALKNPYFGQDHAATALGAPVLLVARLDAASVATARRMLRDSLAREGERVKGFAYIDFSMRRGGYEQGEQWLSGAEERLWAAGIPVVAERHNSLWLHEYPMDQAVVYLGWYAEHARGPFKSEAFRFVPGAVAVHLHSFSAEEVSVNRRWVGPLLESGAAASLGNVFEPYLGLTTHLDVFMDRLLAGYTLAEAAWMATPGLSWMTVVHGDPLYRPFPKELEADSGVGWLAGLWQGQGPQEETMAAVEQRAVEQGDAWLMEAAGLAWQRLGDVDRAIAAFRRAATMTESERARLRLLLHEAEVLRASGRLELAIAMLRQRGEALQDNRVREALQAVLLQIDPPPP